MCVCMVYEYVVYENMCVQVHVFEHPVTMSYSLERGVCLPITLVTLLLPSLTVLGLLYVHTQLLMCVMGI